MEGLRNKVPRAIIAEHIESLREHLHLSQEEMGRLLETEAGCRQGTLPARVISRWESGRTMPNMKYRRALAHIAHERGRKDLVSLLRADAEVWRGLMMCLDMRLAIEGRAA